MGGVGAAERRVSGYRAPSERCRVVFVVLVLVVVVVVIVIMVPKIFFIVTFKLPLYVN
jgi:hypothetical protein